MAILRSGRIKYGEKAYDAKQMPPVTLTCVQIMRQKSET